MTPILYVYNQAFQYSAFGVAAAAGVIYFVILLGLTIFERFTVGRQEPS
jgi:ABC-type sugar transport system permease subunit